MLKHKRKVTTTLTQMQIFVLASMPQVATPDGVSRLLLRHRDLVNPALLAIAAQVHIGVDAGNDARLAILPDGVLALPVDLGFAARVAADVEVMVVEVGREVLVVESHRAVDHRLHAVEPLSEMAEFLHAVDELAA